MFDCTETLILHQLVARRVEELNSVDHQPLPIPISDAVSCNIAALINIGEVLSNHIETDDVQT